MNKNNRNYISLATLLSLCCWQPSVVAGDYSGKVDLVGKKYDEHNRGIRSAKSKEYIDEDDGVTGNIFARYDSDHAYYSSFSSEHILEDNQEYKLLGGKYNWFYYGFAYDETIHNLSFGGKSFYSNPGSANLTYDGSAASTNPHTWKAFDYAIDHKTISGKLGGNLGSNFFVNLDAKRKSSEGSRPTTYALTSSNARASVAEMPEPIDYETTDVMLDLGYRGENFLVSLDGSLSKFDQKNDYMTYKTYLDALTEKASLSPDNKYINASFKGALYHLPLNTHISLNVNKSSLKNDVTLWTSVIRASVAQTLTINRPSFEGKINTDAINFSINSEPFDGFDSKLFYKFYRSKNESSKMTFTSGTSSVNNEHGLLSHFQHTVGLDLHYSKLPLNTKIGTGIEVEKVKRDLRVENSANNDRLFFAEVKNNYFDLLTAKLRYSYLNREDRFLQSNASSIARYLKRFDVATSKQHTLAFATDIAASDNLDLGIEYRHKKYNYPDTTIGLKKSGSHEIYSDASYTLPDILTLSLFVDGETSYAKSTHRYHTTDSASNPSAIDTTTAYNWHSEIKDTIYSYGTNITIPVIEETLQVLLAASRQKNNGQQIFQVSSNSGATLPNIDNWGDYRKDEIAGNIIYSFLKHFEANLGYKYEHFKYSDISTNFYQLTPNLDSSKYPLFTGASNDIPYNVSTVYLMASYKF
ncbi:MAG: MtrB/PioB family outer membrane beta-barrel protein [Oligoflexia bacterium]|nr:MtrB/PioB family outer membrane beta-barrel protein [Oligoflexia bacterium]